MVTETNFVDKIIIMESRVSMKVRSLTKFLKLGGIEAS